ncbi:MAG: hypothetical protein JSS98_12720 [Bacteroidetes bacterium]|nr:hypothetical protein [Bacteroidota bacterium]
MILQIVNTYRRSFGSVLLAFFLLSVTPVKILHSLFANHTDCIVSTNHDSKQTTLTAAGIDCHCNANVVTTPFYAAINSYFIANTISWLPFASIKKQEYKLYIVLHRDSRGPPALV